MLAKAAKNQIGSILISESNKACQSIPLVAFQRSAIESKIRIVGHARFRIDFHPEGVLGVDWGIELIGVRIMPWAPKVLNLREITLLWMVLANYCKG